MGDQNGITDQDNSSIMDRSIPPPSHPLGSSRVDDYDEGKVRLKRQLGLFHGVAFICGLVIGTGIWVAPTAIMQYTNSVGARWVLMLDQ